MFRVLFFGMLTFRAFALHAERPASEVAPLPESEVKLIIVFARPVPCPAESGSSGWSCRSFEQLTRHPAIQRRLAKYDFRIVESRGKPSVSVHDPSGKEAIRWLGVPDAPTFAQMLSLVNAATPHLTDSYRASVEGNAGLAERATALSSLALGDKARGVKILEAMRTEGDDENQQLASVWLARLRGLESISRDEAALLDLARNGTTRGVCFEAWMALGQARLASDRNAKADTAFAEAEKLALPGSETSAVAGARQRVAEASLPLLGTGVSNSVTVGRRIVRPRRVEKGTSRIEFRLDGKLVATAKRTPFASSVNFGRLPVRQLLTVVAFDDAGRSIDRQQVVINERSDAFSVRIVEPARGEVSGVTSVAISVRVPRGRRPERVVVELDGVEIARWISPPYETGIDFATGKPAILRAELRLDDGSEVEDARLFNSGSMALESRVILMEVPVYSETELHARNVVVREAGKVRVIERIVTPAEASLSVALLLDSSGSMAEHILDVQEAALQFTENALEGRDRVMVVSFDSATHVLWPTSDRAAIENAILSLRVRGATSLYDAIASSLLQLQFSGSRRALIVFSDGVDNDSLFSANDVTEIARRAGVPVYTLLVKTRLPSQRVRRGRDAVLLPLVNDRLVRARRALRSLSHATGGKTFDFESLDRLGSTWSAIAEDLRKQSLVVYRTESSETELRPLELKHRGRPLRAPSAVFVTAEPAVEAKP